MIDALAQIKALGDAQQAEGKAAYHKAQRTYLGVSNPDLNDLTKTWRKELTLEERIEVARQLWDSDIHEARVAAAKLLTQARIRPDDQVWELIAGWVPQFDAWAIADHACSAGERRLLADPTRLDEVEAWTKDPNFWVRRAALVMTLPWTKQNHPKPEETAARERILGWAAEYVHDPEWFIQKAVSWWLRSLSGHDPDRVRAFLKAHGDAMKPFAFKDAGRKLP